MKQFETSVPFDPGYSKFAISFPKDIYEVLDQVKTLKPAHRQKFQVTSIESYMLKSINQIAGIHLGCILWGALISNYFKDNPKEIADNPALNKTEKEPEDTNYNEEADFILEFIEFFDKTCKYYLKKPFRIKPEAIEIIKSYREFIDLNQNFNNTRCTNEIKLPESVSHFSELSQEKLENLYQKISAILNSDKIDDILEIGFYTE